jgi:hypothetical protein
VLGGIEAIVWSMGGCVVHVAGDALICAFTGGGDGGDDEEDGDNDGRGLSLAYTRPRVRLISAASLLPLK